MRTINEIILHCSATPEGRVVTVQDIDRWHKEKGYKGIGYHYVIYIDGSVHKGRSDSEIGAHCENHNAHSIGVCYVGGCDAAMNPKDTRTEAQRKAMEKLVQELKLRFPGVTIHGHSEYDKGKACPSFDVQKWRKEVRL